MTLEPLANVVYEVAMARNPHDPLASVGFVTPSNTRAALFSLYLAGQLQFWRKDGEWTETPTGPSRVMGEVYYALARNHAVDVNAWFDWHGEGQWGGRSG